MDLKCAPCIREYPPEPGKLADVGYLQPNVRQWAVSAAEGAQTAVTIVNGEAVCVEHAARTGEWTETLLSRAR